jgi:glycine cleavage system H protein
MVVIMLVLTFAVFIAVDWFLSRKKISALVQEPSAAPVLAPDGAEVIHGFKVVDSVRYHAGHTWARQERKGISQVGADAFAAALAGPVDRISVPRPGTWVRQGQKAISLFRGEEKIELVSPVEGEVVEVNAEVLGNPAVLRQDPYGIGWLLNVHTPDEEGPARNLLPVAMVRGWMRDAADRLFAMQPQLAGATAADGGQPVDDPLAALSAESRRRAAQEFLLN